MMSRGLSAVVFSLLVLTPLECLAQSISLTSPTSDQNLKAGDDFATDVLGNAWDGSSRRMIGWEENFVGTSVSATGGVWRGTNQVAGGYVFPLFAGFKGSLFAEPLPGDKTLPKLGARTLNRIDTSKYTRLAYRLNNTSRSTLAVYWETSDSKSEYWPDPNSPRGASYDGFYHSTGGISNNGYVIYNFDMTNLASSFEQRQGSWSGNIHSLRLDPSVGGAIGAVTEIDWIRLVDPNSAPNITVNWNSSGITSSYVVTVYVDNNNSGYDGTPLRRFAFGSNPGTFTFPSAILPPGQHYIYVEAQQAVGSSFTGPAIRTSYSGRINILNKPEIIIQRPSYTSGDSYAVREAGNDWDMDASGADIFNLNTALFPQILRQFVNASFPTSIDAQKAGRVFQAQGEPPSVYPGQTESDVQLRLNVSQSNPIDPSHYRYLTYRMAIDETAYPTISDKVRDGWVSRLVAWEGNFATRISTKAHVVYEGWKTYSYDLADNSIIETGVPWQSFFRIQNFRLDPAEFTNVYTWFFLDWVQLNAENRTPGNQYVIQFQLADSDSSSMTVDIYYDTDNTGYNGTLIRRMTGMPPGGPYTTVWDTSALPTNTPYYIYFVVSDGTNTTRSYSAVHVKTGTYVPSTPQGRVGFTEQDFDGDGRSDQTVYRGPASTFFINNSTAGFQAIPWGSNIFRPFFGDFDGDGNADRGLLVNYGGLYYWYAIRSSDQALYARIWGVNGDHIAIDDYNGNGRDEIAVFRPSVGGWFILDEQDAARVQYWGLPGDKPVPADYDGDGKADIAIWRPGTGEWYVINSSTGLARVQQWGLPGDVPLARNWGSDSKADFAIWRPSTGTWYVRDNVTAAVTAQQWGLPGDTPRTGDFNGDGVQDFTVYRGGTWYHNYRNGLIGVVQFGLPGDRLPERISLASPF